MHLLGSELDNFKQHCLARYPEEACGVVIGSKFYPTINCAANPLEQFEIDGAEMLRLKLLHGDIQAIVHSHPHQLRSGSKWPPLWPSTFDMQQWLKGSIPWGIVSTEGETVSEPVWMDENHIAPLLGRSFIHGIHDCYSLIRDWYKINKSITLPNYARGMEWWEKGKDLYSDNFKAAGFEEISQSEAAIGDCLLVKIKLPVYHHAGVITGSNTIMHHATTKLSCEDRLDRWLPYAKFVRYTGK